MEKWHHYFSVLTTTFLPFIGPSSLADKLLLPSFVVIYTRIWGNKIECCTFCFKYNWICDKMTHSTIISCSLLNMLLKYQLYCCGKMFLDEIDKDFLPSLSVITIAVFTKMILFQHLIIHIQTISNAREHFTLLKYIHLLYVFWSLISFPFFNFTSF